MKKSKENYYNDEIYKKPVNEASVFAKTIFEKLFIKRNSAMQICLMRSEGRHDSEVMVSSDMIHFPKNVCRKHR